MALTERNVPAVQPAGVLTMVSDFAALKQRLAQLQQFVHEYMIPGDDYGVIEGTGSKPTLLKPGAEKLCDVYGLAAGEAKIDFTRDDTKNPVYISYRVSLPLISRADGRIIMVGVGAANSWEKKYRWRWVFDNELPVGMTPEGLKTRTGTSNKNGRPWTQYRVPNDEIDDIDNTLLKMAKKRALVDAVLSATRSSALFTQDVEDLDGLRVRQADTTERDERRMEQPAPTASMLATDKQLSFLEKQAEAKGLTGQAFVTWVQKTAGKQPEMLTKKDASTLIDAVKTYQPSKEDEVDDESALAGISDEDLPF